MVRIGLIGFGQQGKLYAGILSGIPLPGMPPIPKPKDCVLTAVSARNEACHHLDLWLWLCGIPQSLYAGCKEGAHRNIAVENDVMVVAQYPNGSRGIFTTCSHDLLGTDRLEITFDKGKIILEGNRKATILRYTQPEGRFGETYDFRSFYGVLIQSPEKIYQKEELTAKNAFCSDYVQMFQNFAGYILRDEEPIAPAQAGLAQVQLANAIQLSGWTGREVELPCDEENYNRYLKKKIMEEIK